MKLSPRDEQIFSAVMSLYCDGQGLPVASSRIAKQKGMAVCSATVRNAMARLEKLGLLYSPHTSAGRIPTQEGFSSWFDSYFQLQQLDSIGSHHRVSWLSLRTIWRSDTKCAAA